MADFAPVGPKDYLDRFLAEFDLDPADVGDQIRADGADEWLVHESLLRSHGEFPCAGDAEALAFCREIVRELASLGVPEPEAVALVNQQWSDPAPGGGTPRVWIVGLDIAYHETPAHWARQIHDGRS
ncbi:hypothetical protein GCM10022247_54180 [Allokutzneria multivorans]|uniref:CdiI immunity protein domain-containing protein n=1 Tax=Allokutzneria multivorans TaxID=1142134 RepID=A0ABP7TA58_9PSEU